MNWTDSWKMDQVVQVSTGVMTEDSYETDIDIYELCSGEKYYSSETVRDDSDIKNIKVIFTRKSKNEVKIDESN